MNKKLFLIALLFMFTIISTGMIGAQNAHAQISFPSGCSSALGYSVTTSLPCNGTSTATLAPMPGCTTALGYSITTGRPCDGANEAITFLGGCTSIIGYSTATGAPCNGTSVATTVAVTPTPGLPATGADGNALGNIALLLGSGLLSVFGITYIARRFVAVK